MVSKVKKENGKYASGSKKWWDTVNKITGRKANCVSVNIDPNVINSYFQTIITDDNYTSPELVPIPNEIRIPNVDVSTVEMFLEKRKKTSTGPDGLLLAMEIFCKIFSPSDNKDIQHVIGTAIYMSPSYGNQPILIQYLRKPPSRNVPN